MKFFNRRSSKPNGNGNGKKKKKPTKNRSINLLSFAARKHTGESKQGIRTKEVR
jgi:hypothetical protein